MSLGLMESLSCKSVLWVQFRDKFLKKLLFYTGFQQPRKLFTFAIIIELHTNGYYTLPMRTWTTKIKIKYTPWTFLNKNCKCVETSICK